MTARDSAFLAQEEAAATAGARQARAADPLCSVWAGASAGTGKTKVLIDRVLRLMLPRAGQGEESATRPDKILGLTFTKTAAAEMSNRIYKKLSDWAVMEDAKLKDELHALTGARADAALLQAARRLFARVLDAPGGLKIMTIHSFCQSVLKRFPIEAGLSPHFEMMDEEDALEYLRRCLSDIIAASKKDPASALSCAFNLLALHQDGAAMNDLMAKIMAKRNHLARILKSHGDGEGSAKKTISALYARFRLTPETTEEEVLKNAGALPLEEEAQLKRAVAALLEGKKTDVEAGTAMQPWLERPQDRAALHGAYRRAFLKDDGEVRARLATKDVQEKFPEITDVMRREGERLRRADEALRAVRFCALNAALLTLSADMVGRYERHKRKTDRLDFDDLILKTCDLLADKDMVNWVLFKLDEGIDHILVDEAQDTNPYQWRVIKALSHEFFSGLGRAEDAPRTLFVVGDEKQSIFSFHGADPAEFARMQAYFGARAADVQEGWEVFLEHSFRSTRAVLDVVDAVFGAEDVRQGVVADIARDVRHLPFRAGAAGRVELWPLIRAHKVPPQDPWALPLAVEAGENAASALARTMAETIRNWLDTGEKLPARGRAVRAGDILILVQSRGALVEKIMRALKEKNVPLAGIDRMTLTEEIAVMDLLALAQFALQPRDDLTLAALLKSPLIGMDEQELYDICAHRPSTLFEAVKRATPRVAEYLERWIRKSGYATPYEFFAEALSTPCAADGTSGRRAFYGRLGEDIADALDEFLNAALHYEQSHTPSLQGFVDRFMRGEAEIKREQEQHRHDQVRIMTVHGAKGLQAPIVFLPDAARKGHDHPGARIRLIWPQDAQEDEKGMPLWSPRKEFDAALYAPLRDAARARQEEEYRRLLYVALTRAEDRLYVCGHQSGKGAPAGDCWHSLLDAHFPQDALRVPFTQDGVAMTDDDGVPFMTKVHSCAQEAPPALEKAAEGEKSAPVPPRPAWVLEGAPAEPAPAVPLAPSRPTDEEPAAMGPLAQSEDWRFRRGIVVHKILEILPQIAPEKRASALAAALARPALDLDAPRQKELAQEIMAVMTHAAFAPIFGAGSRAEVPVVGLVGETVSDKKTAQALSGQIDRLLVRDDEILIVDYKTNRPPPSRAEDVPALYLKQMAAYVSLLRRVYPDRAVRCALLWTDGPRLMPLPEAMLEKYLL